MPRPRHESREQRQARFEQFEQRLVMSAQAVASLLPELEIAAPALTQQVVMHPLLNNTSPTTQAASIANQYGFDGAGQTIAVIDSGIAWDHYALGGGFGAGHKVVGGWDFAENDANPYDDGPAGFHGTHVSGIIGSNDEQYRGVSSGADLVALRVFDDQGAGDLRWVEQALQWVHDHRNDFANPITTVNLSLGTNWNAFTTPAWATLEDEFAQLATDGLFISVAAGNAFQTYGSAGLSYPAVSSHVVPVASHNANGSISDFSQRAANVLVAPGESIVSTVPDHLFGGLSTNRFLGSTGTSMSAPYVAGASAILRQANEFMGVTGINQDMLYQQFRDTADRIFDSVTNGYYYKINLQAALAAVVTNLNDDAVSLTSGVLTVNGTNQNDTITVDTSDGFSVNVNGVGYRFNQAEVQSIQIDGQGGQDSIQLNLGSQNDTASTRPNMVRVSNHQFQLNAKSFEAVNIHAGTGVDTITMFDTAGNDMFSANANSATLTGNGISHTANGFDRVRSVSRSGFDTAQLQGTSGNDLFVSRNDRQTLKAGSTVINADHFNAIQVDGGGGWDRANVFGSQGNDRFVVRPTYVHVDNHSYRVWANGFESINAIAGADNDTVTMYDSAADDVFKYKNEVALMTGPGYTTAAHGFHQISVIASGGNDLAHIYDTAGNDTFTSAGNWTELKSAGYRVEMVGFERVNAIANHGGYDTAILVGSNGTDRLQADLNSVTLKDHSDQIRRAVGFENSQVDLRGGVDHAVLKGSSNNERLRAGYTDIEFETTRQLLQLKNAEHTKFDGRGGVDEVQFEDFQTLDLLESLGDRATAYLRDHSVTAVDFAILEARSVDNAIADYDLEAVDYLYMLRGQWRQR